MPCPRSPTCPASNISHCPAGPAPSTACASCAWLPKLAHLHTEREHLTPSIFRFAAHMPALTRLTGLDEFGDEGPMPPADVEQVRATLPHITMD